MYHTVKEINIIREKVFKRDNYKCFHCNETEWLVIHHLDESGGIENGWRYANNKLENLITLCRSCHTKIYHRTPKIKGILHLG